MIPELRPYQLDLVARLRAAVGRGHQRIVMQAPTGSGKTNVACYMAKQAIGKEKRVLFLVHRRKLVEQIHERLINFEVDNGIIMRGTKAYRSALVQVGSRDTITSRCFTHEWTGLPPADLVFVDEAHHAVDPASDHRRIIEQYPRAVIILMTATPVGPNDTGMGPWAQALECAAPITQLVRDGYLCPVKCFAPDRKKGRGGKFKRGVSGDLVESWKQFGADLPTVLFCSRVQHSLDAVEAYKAAGIPAAHMDADTPDDTRDAIYDGLESGKVKIVSNVGIVGEGVDVPALGCVQWFMDVNGRVKFLQGCGRIMRPFAGKSHGIIIDHAGAIFRHGFPDEDQEWALEGNADAEFKKKHDDGKTEKPLYCKKCELVYHGQMNCPNCGLAPSKPPRSIFAPPPIDSTNELLTEAERARDVGVFSREAKVSHWLRCLGVAAARRDVHDGLGDLQAEVQGMAGERLPLSSRLGQPAPAGGGPVSELRPQEGEVMNEADIYCQHCGANYLAAGKTDHSSACPNYIEDTDKWKATMFGVYPTEGFASDCIALFANEQAASDWTANNNWGCELTVIETKIAGEINS